MATRRSSGPAEIKQAIRHAVQELQKRIKNQLNLILRHPDFKKLETPWRSLRMLIDRTDFDADIQIDVLQASKEDLRKDFKKVGAEVFESGLRYHLYEGYGVSGADPFSAVVANLDFDQSEPDIELLESIAKVAQSVHTPFLAAPAPSFFGIKSFDELPQQKLSKLWERLEANRDGDPFGTLKWREFRGKEEARYISLALPRFILRKPYGKENPCSRLDFFEESVLGDRDAYCWGNAAFALASRLTDSFAKNDGWYDDIIGFKSGGRIDDMPVPLFQVGAVSRKLATETLLTDEFVHQLGMLGFVPLVMHKNSSSVFFQSASSTQRPKEFPKTPEGMTAQENYQLGTQLPYMLMTSRLAHYLKVIQRKQLGSLQTDKDIKSRLDAWLGEFHTADDNADEATRKKRPLRDFKVTVSPIDGEAGYYNIEIKIVPFIRYAGADVTISLEGKLGDSK